MSVVIVACEMVILSHMDVLLGILDYSRESIVFSLNDSLFFRQGTDCSAWIDVFKNKKIEKYWLRHTCQ